MMLIFQRGRSPRRSHARDLTSLKLGATWRASVVGLASWCRAPVTDRPVSDSSSSAHDAGIGSRPSSLSSTAKIIARPGPHECDVQRAEGLSRQLLNDGGR